MPAGSRRHRGKSTRKRPMKNSEPVEKHRDRLIEEGMKLYKEHPAYQVDMYLYPDGTN